MVTGGIGNIQQEGGDFKLVPDVGVQWCVDLPSQWGIGLVSWSGVKECVGKRWDDRIDGIVRSCKGCGRAFAVGKREVGASGLGGLGSVEIDD